jgi:hypothetical protein
MQFCGKPCLRKPALDRLILAAECIQVKQHQRIQHHIYNELFNNVLIGPVSTVQNKQRHSNKLLLADRRGAIK